MVGLLAFLVFTCVLGSSYVRSQETVLTNGSNSNPSVQIASETELIAGNIQVTKALTPPNSGLNTIQVTEATVQSPSSEPVKPLAQQTEEEVALVNQESDTEPPATNANPAPEVTQSPAAVNQIPVATLEGPTEPIHTAANTIEKVAEVNPVQLAPAATNKLESVTMPSNPASSVTIPSTGSTNPSSTRLNATLNEERAAEPINTPANTVEKVSAENPIYAEPEPNTAEKVSAINPIPLKPEHTALDTALTQIVKPASTVTKPTSAVANSVPIEVNPATATETPVLIREIEASAVGVGSAGTVAATAETPEPSVNSSAIANATSTGITALNTDEVDASSIGFKATAVDRLITSTPIDPRVILQKRIDQDAVGLGAELQSSIDFYAESRVNLNGLLRDVNLRHEIAEVALKNLRRILTEIITEPTKQVTLADVFRRAIVIRDTPIDTSTSTLAPAAPVNTGASA